MKRKQVKEVQEQINLAMRSPARDLYKEWYERQKRLINNQETVLLYPT